MQWSSALDDEFEDLMEDWPVLEPAIERACRFEDQIERLEQEVRELRAGKEPNESH